MFLLLLFLLLLLLSTPAHGASARLASLRHRLSCLSILIHAPPHTPSWPLSSHMVHQCLQLKWYLLYWLIFLLSFPTSIFPYCIMLVSLTFCICFTMYTNDNLCMDWLNLLVERKLQDGGGNVQFSSVAQSYPTLCDPMDCSTPGFPIWCVLLSSLVVSYSALERPGIPALLCLLEIFLLARKG